MTENCTKKLITALGGLAEVACSPDRVQEVDVPTYCDVMTCSRECASLEVTACDIATERCQAMVQRSVECVRGIRFDRRPTVVLEFVDAGGDPARPEADAGGANDAGRLADARPAQTDASLRGESRAVPLVVSKEDLPQPGQVMSYHQTQALHELGLLAREMDLTQAWVEAGENIAGTYSVMEDVLNVVVWPERDAWSEMGTLAHEMVHALQDQERDLDEWSTELLQGDTSVQAYRAFIEGEAELYQLLALHLMLKLPFSSERMEELARNSKKWLMRTVVASDSPGITSLQSVVYSAGLGLVLDQWLRDGNDGVNSLADDFPEDLAAWMRQDDRSTPVQLSCDDIESSSEANLTELFRVNEQPDLLLPLLLTKQDEHDGVEFARAWDATGAWRGDCMQVFGESFAPVSYSNPPPPAIDAGTRTKSLLDAGVDASAAASNVTQDAGQVTIPPVYLADVLVRWTIEFEDEQTAEWVNATLTEADWTGEATSEQQGRRVLLQVRSQGERAPQSPLVECWPLYPFDPNEVYLLGDGISHWQQPELTLGSTRSLRSSIRGDGEVLLLDKYVMTPDWCQLPGDDRRQSEDGEAATERANDLTLPFPCDDPLRDAKLGATDERLFGCDRASGDWVDGDGHRVVSGETGRLVEIGHHQTLLLSTGVFHRGGLSVDVPGVQIDAGAVTDAGMMAGGGSEFRRDFEEGTLLQFQGLSVTEQPVSTTSLPEASMSAARALPNGYWVVQEPPAGSSDMPYSLWYVDYLGRAEQVVDYGALPSGTDGAVASTRLDGFGTLYVLTGESGPQTLTVLPMDGPIMQVPLTRSRGQLRLVTGP